MTACSGWSKFATSLAGRAGSICINTGMGPQGGFVIHWSRLVDAPIAAIILEVSAFTGKLATGETSALLAWSTRLMAAAGVHC